MLIRKTLLGLAVIQALATSVFAYGWTGLAFCGFYITDSGSSPCDADGSRALIAFLQVLPLLAAAWFITIAVARRKPWAYWVITLEMFVVGIYGVIEMVGHAFIYSNGPDWFGGAIGFASLLLGAVSAVSIVRTRRLS